LELTPETGSTMTLPVRGVIKKEVVNGFEGFDEEGLKNVRFGREIREKFFLFEEGWRNLNHGELRV